MRFDIDSLKFKPIIDNNPFGFLKNYQVKMKAKNLSDKVLKVMGMKEK